MNQCLPPIRHRTTLLSVDAALGSFSVKESLGPVEISIDSNGIYTILARDDANLSGVGLTLMDDF